MLSSSLSLVLLLVIICVRDTVRVQTDSRNVLNWEIRVYWLSKVKQVVKGSLSWPSERKVLGEIRVRLALPASGICCESLSSRIITRVNSVSLQYIERVSVCRPFILSERGLRHKDWWWNLFLTWNLFPSLFNRNLTEDSPSRETRERVPSL